MAVNIGFGGNPLATIFTFKGIFGVPISHGQYRLLEPHYINNQVFAVGAVLTEGVELPEGWIPTLAVDPLNNDAVKAFYAAGPRGIAYEDLAQWARATPQDGPQLTTRAVTFWIKQGGFYKLTGLGADPVAFPPIGGPG